VQLPYFLYYKNMSEADSNIVISKPTQNPETITLQQPPSQQDQDMLKPQPNKQDEVSIKTLEEANSPDTQHLSATISTYVERIMSDIITKAKSATEIPDINLDNLTLEIEKQLAENKNPYIANKQLIRLLVAKSLAAEMLFSKTYPQNPLKAAEILARYPQILKLKDFEGVIPEIEKSLLTTLNIDRLLKQQGNEFVWKKLFEVACADSSPVNQELKDKLQRALSFIRGAELPQKIREAKRPGQQLTPAELVKIINETTGLNIGENNLTMALTNLKNAKEIFNGVNFDQLTEDNYPLVLAALANPAFLPADTTTESQRQELNQYASGDEKQRLQMRLIALGIAANTLKDNPEQTVLILTALFVSRKDNALTEMKNLSFGDVKQLVGQIYDKLPYNYKNHSSLVNRPK
jgi:hypothetical protein